MRVAVAFTIAIPEANITLLAAVHTLPVIHIQADRLRGKQSCGFSPRFRFTSLANPSNAEGAPLGGRAFFLAETAIPKRISRLFLQAVAVELLDRSDNGYRHFQSFLALQRG